MKFFFAILPIACLCPVLSLPFPAARIYWPKTGRFSLGKVRARSLSFMARSTALQKAIKRQMPREERVALLVALARGVKVVKKRRSVDGQKAYWVKLEGDEEVYRTPPSETALAKLNEWADRPKDKAGNSNSQRAGIIVEVLEADDVDGASPGRSRSSEKTSEGFPDLLELDDTNTAESDQVGHEQAAQSDA